MKPREKCVCVFFFQTEGWMVTIFRDRKYLVFCFLGFVVKLQAREGCEGRGRVFHYLTASLPGSSHFLLPIFTPSAFTMFFYVTRKVKHSIEDWLNLKWFRSFTALHWKRDVSKEPFQFILEASYRWLIKYRCAPSNWRHKKAQQMLSC